MNCKSAALLFGLNYDRTPDARLRGCINDVRNMESLLKEYEFDDIRVFTDYSHYAQTTGRGILQELNQMADRSHAGQLDLVWIHYSGHGCSMRDIGVRDELDGKDECLVPSDFKTGGVVPDDYIKQCLRRFRPETRVIFVADCCHSGTIGDLRYRYKNNKPVTENWQTPCAATVLLFSGCTDQQTSADAFNVNRMRKFSGAMTSCLIQALKECGHGRSNVFQLLERVRLKLRQKRFTQIPQLTSSKQIHEKETLF
jgi:hypothetical protein